MMDLAEAMRGLYETGEYFVRREIRDTPAFEENYWGEVIDPDGERRCRFAERERYIEDISHVLGFLGSIEPGAILDVGCGPGFLLSALEESWSRYGVEVSQKATDHAVQYGRIHRGTVSDAPFPDNGFDVVVLYHVIEHVEDPVSVILKIRELLKPQGILILGSPDFDSGCARRFGMNYRLLHDETHISLFSNDSMHRFLRDHGFQIFRTDYPYFETRFFTKENLDRLFDTSAVSPPFYGNFMTFFCRNGKPGGRLSGSGRS